MSMSNTYYDANAKAYFDLTVNVDMTALYPVFLQYITPAGRILDAGCGSGRDSLAFTRLGFQVDAIDGSAEMAKLASEFTQLPVKHLAFEHLNEHERYDAIWSCASLLHTPFSDLPALFTRFERALKPGGTWYLSFKHGQGGKRLTAGILPISTHLR